ncbi:hypothetical protein HYR99_12675 [Candidatus Poribacteria bacterium]|nr:hypothetical protein [Candidatus Poribacteria bacterium]
MGTALFRKKTGYLTRPRDGIIDTGGAFSVLPPDLWRDLEVTIEEKRTWLQGVNRQQRCRIAASLGTVKFRLIDIDGGMTDELEVIAYLVKRAEVPIIFGMADFLEKYQLQLDHRSGKAFLDETVL